MTEDQLAELFYLGQLTQQEEETMNTNIDNLKTDPTFKPVPLTDAEVETLLAAKVLDGTVYITDADETADEPAAPTIH